jgi:hypothetical protein
LIVTTDTLAEIGRYEAAVNAWIADAAKCLEKP